MTGKFDGYENAVRELAIANAAIQEAAMKPKHESRIAFSSSIAKTSRHAASLVSIPSGASHGESAWGDRSKRLRRTNTFTAGTSRYDRRASAFLILSDSDPSPPTERN